MERKRATSARGKTTKRVTPKRKVKTRLPRGKGNERIPDILAAALIEFETYGYTGASVDDIARRVGISKPIVYRYFKNKEALLKALLTDRLAVNYGLAAEYIAAYDGPLKPLLRMVVARGSMINEPASAMAMSVFRLVISDGHRMPAHARDFYYRSFRPVNQALQTVFTRAMAKGAMRKADPEMAARELVAPHFHTAVVRMLIGAEEHTTWHGADYMANALESFCRSYEITE
jgi:AcrR family transcriptional regulator